MMLMIDNDDDDVDDSKDENCDNDKIHVQTNTESVQCLRSTPIITKFM